MLLNNGYLVSRRLPEPLPALIIQRAYSCGPNLSLYDGGIPTNMYGQALTEMVRDQIIEGYMRRASVLVYLYMVLIV